MKTPHTRTSGITLSLLAVVALTAARTMPAGAATPDQVDAAVAQGVAMLYAQEHNGNWERVPTPDPPTADPMLSQQKVTGGQWGGLTALATLTLLAAGENPSDPRLASAIDFLKQADLRGNYAVALRAQIWQYLDYEHAADIKNYINRDAELLVDSVQNPGTAPGMYNYFVKPYNNYNWYDHSNSQIAVLGVWSLAETDVVEIPAKYWRLVDQGWKSHQYSDGGWSYKFNDPTSEGSERTLNMTSAGVATLYITQDYLRQNTDCVGNFDNPNIEAGVRWMIANYAAQAGMSRGVSEFSLTCYGLYGTERVGQASGRKYLGTIDWFKQGSDLAIGALGGQIPDNCFALLFLVHGRAPVMLNKLEYKIDMHGDQTKESNWDQRPADARRLARWEGKSTELEFNWQIVNLDVPVDELHDAPILYIAGDQSLDFTKEEEAKLRQFCQDGGLIMFNADCSSSRFSTSVIQLGTRLFPGSEFRNLPADHAIYTDEQFKRIHWRQKPTVEGLTNGSRELMILFPHDDPARYWQSGAYGGVEDRHEVAADVFQYIAGNITKLRKGRNFIVRPNPGAGGGPAIKVARLQYAGNWDPEPGGWRRLAAILHNAALGELTTETVKLGDGKLSGYKIADLTGTYAYKLTDAARAELKSFIDAGGTLIIDSCGGNQPFTASMTDELNAMVGLKEPLPVLPPASPVFAAGPKIDKFEYRRMTRKLVGSINAPRLRGLDINGRVAVFLSPEDLSTGLVGVPCDGVYGYDPATATAIMTDILLYAGK